MSENTYELVPKDIAVESEEVDFQKAVDTAFSTGLAAAIMSQFPVASIIAIFKGHKGKKMVVQIDEITEKTGVSGGAMRILAKIFSIFGFVNGIVCTAIYAWLAVYYFSYFSVLIFAFLVSLLNLAI